MVEIAVPGGAWAPPEPAFPILGPGDPAEPGAIGAGAIPAPPERPPAWWNDVVDESQVLCFGCVHGWFIWKHAPVRNLKPDGSPYLWREGWCLLPAAHPGGGPLPLEDRYVLRCTGHVPAPDAEARAAVGRQPWTSGSDVGGPAPPGRV